MLPGVVLLLLAPLSAQEHPSRNLADAARSIQPELGADVLIRLVESKKISEVPQRIKLLEDAFALAAAARYPLRLRGIASWTDNREWALDRGLALGLSATSLRVRVVKAMLPLDPPRARRLFDTITVQLAPLSCKDTYDYDLHDYFEAVDAILTSGFTPAERKKEADMVWFGDKIRSISSPYQLEEVALILENERWPKRQLEFLISGFSLIMKQMTADPLSLQRKMNYGLQQRMFNLSRVLLKHEIPTLPLLDAYRTLLVRAMRGTRCVPPKRPSSDSYTEMVKLFNSDMRKLAPVGSEPIAPITTEESQPVATEESGQVHDYWKTDQTIALMAGQRRLRFGTPEQQAANEKIPQRVRGTLNFLTADQRRENEWETALREFLNEVDRWNRDHKEQDADHFHQLVMVYQHIHWLTPPGDLRRQILERLVTTLKTSPVAVTSPPEWYAELDRLLRSSELNPEERRQVREEVKRSGDAAMVLYADLMEYTVGN